jgi:hypothetical protein
MGVRAGPFGHWVPWFAPRLTTTIVGMRTADPLHHRAAELLEAARAFQADAGQPGSHEAGVDSLASLEEALQILSAAWYQLAADASSGIAERAHGRGLSREQEVRLMATLHDIAAAFARCARTCREGRSTVTPIVARHLAARRADDQRRDELSWFESRERPTERVA